MKASMWFALFLTGALACSGWAADEPSDSARWYGRVDLGGNFSNGAGLTL